MNTKVCKECLEEKLLTDFHKSKECKYGVANVCKVCKSFQMKVRYLEVRDTMLEYKARQYKENPEKFLTRNRERSPEKKQQYRQKYVESNRDYFIARNATRRASKLSATPPWLTMEDKQSIRSMYKLAKDKTLTDGVSYHVDHIIPLNGEIVCGLHVPWNLQVIPAEENLKKGNKLLEAHKQP